MVCLPIQSANVQRNLLIKVSYAVLLLLHFENGAILEGPLDDIRLFARALDELALGDGGPELGEVLELDVVPNVGERGLDDGRFDDGGAGWDCSGHCACLVRLE